MKYFNLILLFVTMITLSGCEVIGDIFGAGFYTGIFVVIFVIVIIVVLISKIFRR